IKGCSQKMTAALMIILLKTVPVKECSLAGIPPLAALLLDRKTALDNCLKKNIFFFFQLPL
ncbi:MAG: hypothetical protein J7M03_07745, partial [Candidatus Desulfofervidaceae bacterium]|nr:hypothetical protein [Candidatus Desulfofervidaceae bacterium]